MILNKVTPGEKYKFFMMRRDQFGQFLHTEIVLGISSEVNLTGRIK